MILMRKKEAVVKAEVEELSLEEVVVVEAYPTITTEDAEKSRHFERNKAELRVRHDRERGPLSCRCC